MDTFQRNLENLFCPSLDSAVIAAIVNDGHDRNTCFKILNDLATEANLALDRERDSFVPSETWSENSSSKSTSGENVENGRKKVLRHRNKSKKGRYSPEDSSSTEDAMTRGLETRIESLYLGDDFDSGCNMSTASDEIPLDEEIKQLDLFHASKDPPESPEGFLKTCFPTLSGEKLEILLRENGNDPEKVIDIVLNEVFLETEQENDSNLSSASTTSSFDTRDEDFNGTLSLGARSKHRKKKRRKQPRQNNVIFQNSGHRPDTNHYSPPPVSQDQNLKFSSIPSNSPPALPVSPTSPNLSLANNRWKSIENELRQLSSMLPYFHYRKINSIFHTHGNLTDTVRELISLCPSESTGESLSDQSLSQLISVFPDHDILILKKALVGTNGSVQNATHLLHCSSNSDNQKSPSLLNGISFETREYHAVYDKTQNGVPSSNNISNNSNNTLEFFFTVQPPPVDDKFCFEYEEEDDPRHCRKMARQCMEKRNEAFRKAVVAFRKAKGHARSGEGGIAFYYSDEGRNHDAQMKRWNLKAARLLVKRNSNRDHNLVDLHGLSVNEALTMVKEGLEQWSERTTKNPYAPVKPLKIVTGLGNHSINGVAKLPPAVARMLEKEKWDFDHCQGYFLVKGTKIGNIP